MAEALYLKADSRDDSLYIDRGRIDSVASAPPEGATTLDCTDTRIAPGRVNAHTHLYSGLAPLGMPAPSVPPENFVQILERVWWRLDRALDETSLRASARLYIAEALLHGTTSLIDHHESPGFIEGSLDILADACAELGMRALLCYGATERNGDRDEAQAGLAECRRFIENNRHGNLRGLVALHASFTVSDETIREAGELCRDLGTVLHIHLAEDQADVDDAKERGYDGPLERLEQLEALVPGSILAHGIYLSEEQVARATKAGCWFVQNPRSNLGNKVGYPLALVATDRVALGTDGYPADMVAEADALAELAGARQQSEAAAARPGTGALIVGEQFDCTLGTLQRDAAADLLVQGQADALPRHVLVGGRVVVKDGVLVTGNIASIRAEAATEAAKLWKRMEAL